MDTSRMCEVIWPSTLLPSVPSFLPSSLAHPSTAPRPIALPLRVEVTVWGMGGGCRGRKVGEVGEEREMRKREGREGREGDISLFL